MVRTFVPFFGTGLLGIAATHARVYIVEPWVCTNIFPMNVPFILLHSIDTKFRYAFRTPHLHHLCNLQHHQPHGSCWSVLMFVIEITLVRNRRGPCQQASYRGTRLNRGWPVQRKFAHDKDVKFDCAGITTAIAAYTKANSNTTTCKPKTSSTSTLNT